MPPRNSQENDIRYANGSVYGSVAYDLNRWDNTAYAAEPAVEYDFPERETAPETRPERAPAVRPETKQGLSLLAIVSFVMLTGLMIAILMAYVELTAIQTETSELTAQLQELRQNEARLTIKYENTFDMESIEEYALNVLGMEKLAENQVTVLDNVRPDKAVVLSGTRQKDDGILRTAIAAIVEYFR